MTADARWALAPASRQYCWLFVIVINLNDWTVIAKRLKVGSIDVFEYVDVPCRYVGEFCSNSVHRQCVIVVWSETDVKSADIDAVDDAKVTQHVLWVRGERLVASDEVVVDATGLTEHGLRCEVEVIERLIPRVDDVLDELGERHVVASVQRSTGRVGAVTTNYPWSQLQ